MTGWRLSKYDTLDSTSDLCLALARAGEPDGMAVLARRQTGGRGSRGRQWESPPGNLYLSVLLRPTGDAAEAGRWALLAGVAFADALETVLPDRTALRLKWPNDVLLAGHKLAGILIDSAIDGRGGLEFLVIGFGANLANAPPVPGRKVAALVQVGGDATPEAMAGTLLERLAHWRRLRLIDGFAAVREAWLERAHPLGTRLVLRVAGRKLAGTFAGLDEDGSLLLQGSGGIKRLSTAEILSASEP